MTKLLRKKLFIFDVDGTVWDSEPDVFLSFNNTLRNNLDFEISKEQFQLLAGMPLEAMFETILPEEKRYLSKELEKKYKQYYIDEGHFADATTLFSGVKSTLEFFKNKGFLMTIASSKPKRILDKMVKHFELIEFDLILGTEESKFKHKPNPEIIYYILQELNVSKEDAVIVGDSKSDILAGKNAGISTIAVTYGFDRVENLIALEPDFILDRFDDLTKIIKMVDT
jgi:phosphoglycolate phosphatase